jgi:hypothetical protein
MKTTPKRKKPYTAQQLEAARIELARRQRDGLPGRKFVDAGDADLLNEREIEAIIADHRRPTPSFTDEERNALLLRQWLAHDAADPRGERRPAGAEITRQWMRRRVSAILGGIPPQQVFALPKQGGRPAECPPSRTIAHLVREKMAAEHIYKLTRALELVADDLHLTPRTLRKGLGPTQLQALKKHAAELSKQERPAAT